jgi:uroporphyrinogen III methyltransferase/synthase
MMEIGSDTQPLAGQKIVVTRAREQAGKLAEQLQARGAEIIEFPTIEIRAVEEALQVGDLERYDWVIFTSVNAVEFFAQGIEALGHPIRQIENASVCAVGPATKRVVENLGLKVALVPEKFKAESVVEALQGSIIDPDAWRGLTFLLPRGDLARDCLPKALRALGADVTELIVYRNVKPDIDEGAIQALIDKQPDWVTFTSASTAKNFSEMLKGHDLDKLGRRYACIGPTTSQAARDGGITVSVQPEQHDIPGLVEAMVEWTRADSASDQ